jgi:imidazolonepropionase-like amidohydrolase
MIEARTVAFVDVNVAPMNQIEILEKRTVMVSNGRIVDIGETAGIRIPDDALRIDGKSRYLLPGLTDMHVHQWGQGDLLLFLANGVTTIRNMWGTSRQLVWRNKIAKGQLLGPTIYTAGPLLDGKPPIWNGSKVIETTEEAEQEVARENKAGYDFIKVYNGLSLEVYDAIIAAANKYRMQVTGHVPYAVGLEHALKAGQNSIEHLTGYFAAIEADDSPFKGKHDPQSRYGAPDYVDEAKISQVVMDTSRAGTWNCVTLIVNQKFIPSQENPQILRRPEMKYASPLDLASWDPSKDFRLKTMTASDFEKVRKGDKLRLRLTKALHDAGAHVLLGTDTPNPFVVQGFSIHEELRNLVQAGLTPFEAIKAGTCDAAQFLNATQEFGTIEVGKRADLILVNGNPLEDVSNLSHPIGVMVRGQWFTEMQLQNMLAELVTTYPMTEKKLGNMPPLPSEGQHIIAGRYQLRLSNTIIGEERFNLEKKTNGKLVIFSRSIVNAPPRLDVFSMRLELSESGGEPLKFESDRLEGRGRAQMLRKNMRTIEITAKMPGQAEIHLEKDVAEDTILGCPLISTYLAVNNRISSLEVGQETAFPMIRFEMDPEFEIIEARLSVERKDDIEKKQSNDKVLRVYAIKDTRRNASYEAALVMDGQGRPVSFETIGQMGDFQANLVEPLSKLS